jgi:hypothetical protein
MNSTNQNAPYTQVQTRPSNEQVVYPLMMKHTNPPLAANLPPKGTIASQLGHTHDYQLVGACVMWLKMTCYIAFLIKI